MAWPIPTSGEAMVQLKGRVGSSRGRYRRNNMSRIRKGYGAKKPQWIVPWGLGQEPEAATSDTWVWNERYLPGATGAGNVYESWIWSLQLESLFGSGGVTPSWGYDNGGDNDRLRIVGMQGSMYFTPIVSFSDAYQPESQVGYVCTYWYKIKSSGYDTTLQKRIWPWGQGDDVDTVNGVAGFTNAYKADGQDQERDARMRADLMFHTHDTWNLQPGYNVDATSWQNIPNSTRISLPKKIMANVGRGETLAMCIQYGAYATQASGRAPTAVLDYRSVRFKAYELD